MNLINASISFFEHFSIKWDKNGKPTGGWSYEEECEYYYYIFTTNYEWEEQVQEGIELYKEYQEELDDE